MEISEPAPEFCLTPLTSHDPVESRLLRTNNSWIQGFQSEEAHEQVNTTDDYNVLTAAGSMPNQVTARAANTQPAVDLFLDGVVQTSDFAFGGFIHKSLPTNGGEFFLWPEKGGHGRIWPDIRRMRGVAHESREWHE